MNDLTPIKIPLLNPNEPEALLAAVEAEEGQAVEEGKIIALVETTKSTAEILAEKSGYLVGLRFKPGETLQAGEVLAYIGNSPEASDPNLLPWAKNDAVNAEEESGFEELRITEPARELARHSGVDLSTLPTDRIITRGIIEKILTPKTPTGPAGVPEGDQGILVYGAGGHGRSVVALLRALGKYDILGFLDDGYPIGETVYGLTVLGGAEQLGKMAQNGLRMAINAVGGIGDLQVRLRVFDRLHGAGFFNPTIIHPTAFLEQSSQLDHGVQVFPFAYVGTEVEVGYGGIINTGTIVSHNCILEPYVNLSPGATLAGGVTVGEGALIGMRATVNLYVHIGRRARIGNGATVKDDVPDGGVVPAGTIWPPRQ